MTCQDSFHEVAFNISFWTRNISSARILFWRGVPIFLVDLPFTVSNSITILRGFDDVCFPEGASVA